MITFEYHDMPLCGDDGITDTTPEVDVEVDLVMTEPADPGTPASLNYPGDPPWPAVFEVQEVRLTRRLENLMGVELTTLKLTEQEFGLFFAQGQDIMNNAYEWAAEQED